MRVLSGIFFLLYLYLFVVLLIIDVGGQGGREGGELDEHRYHHSCFSSFLYLLVSQVSTTHSITKQPYAALMGAAGGERQLLLRQDALNNESTWGPRIIIRPPPVVTPSLPLGPATSVHVFLLADASEHDPCTDCNAPTCPGCVLRNAALAHRPSTSSPLTAAAARRGWSSCCW